MSRIIKRSISVLAIAAAVLTISGCSSKTCSVCGKTYSGGGATQTIMGQEVNVCPDCINAAGNILSNLG